MENNLHILTNTYTRIDPRFGRENGPVELDLGCGKGGFLLELARRTRGVVLGADVMLGRLRKVARKAERAQLINIELLRADNIELVGYQLPDDCVRRVHLLCPDPWPKKRHRHRRLVTTDFLTRLMRVLEHDGVFHFSTDDRDYFEAVRKTAAQLPFYQEDRDLASIRDVMDIETDFERLWRQEGRSVPHAAFRVNKLEETVLLA